MWNFGAASAYFFARKSASPCPNWSRAIDLSGPYPIDFMRFFQITSGARSPQSKPASSFDLALSAPPDDVDDEDGDAEDGDDEAVVPAAGTPPDGFEETADGVAPTALVGAINCGPPSAGTVPEATTGYVGVAVAGTLAEACTTPASGPPAGRL